MDTLEDIADAMNCALAEYGFGGHPVESYRYFVGEGMAELVRRAVLQAADEATIDRILRAAKRNYSRHWADKTRVYEGIGEVLSHLGRRGVGMGVLSNKPDEFTHIIVEHYFGRGIFSVVRGLKDGQAAKPDASGALETASELGVKCEEVLYVGDSDIDMQTAKGAGMWAVGAAWGFRGEEELREAGADAVVKEPLELLHFFDREEEK